MSSMDKINKLSRSLSDKYYKLILLVGKSGTGKTRLINNLCDDNRYRYVNLSLILSEKFKDLPFEDRGYYVQDYIDAIVKGNQGDILVLDNIEIIFSKHLEIEPLSLLRNIAKYRKVIAAWQGSIKDGYLTYAEPWHEDYVRYNVNELECLYINIEGSL